MTSPNIESTPDSSPGSFRLSYTTEGDTKSWGLQEGFLGDQECIAAAMEPALRNHPRYELLRLLGRGGMGVVWLARHRTMDRLVAIKVVRLPQLSQDISISWFQREARMISKLKHENIVSAYDAEDIGDTRFIVFEYVEGETLSETVKRGVLSLSDSLEITRVVAQGLQYAHARGLVHRDIKPSNLIRDTQGTVKILDFGIAIDLHSQRSSMQDVTPLVQGPVGTFHYLAPECFVSNAPSVRADIYSLGCTLYHLLFGQSLVSERLQMGLDAWSNHYPSPHFAEQPAEVQSLIISMTSHNPAERPATAAEVVANIEELQTSLGLSHGEQPERQKSNNHAKSGSRKRWNRRHLIGGIAAIASLPISASILYHNDWLGDSGGFAHNESKQKNILRSLYQKVNVLGEGVNRELIHPVTLGSGNVSMYSVSGNCVSLHTYSRNDQVWLTYHDMHATNLCLVAKTKMIRFARNLSYFKLTVMGDADSEYSLLWKCANGLELLELEKAMHDKIDTLWSTSNLSTGETKELMVNVANNVIQVFAEDQLLYEVPHDDMAKTRFPALAAYSCDLDFIALARSYV